jgi:hypothetical protein
MLDSTLAAAIYLGNDSTVTPYTVPFPVRSSADVHVTVTAQGSGTVTVTDGAAVFSTAQPLIVIGSRVRIGTVVYEVAARTSDTVFAFKTRPTITASNFHLLDTATELSTEQFTISADGVRTVTAVPATSRVTVYRRTPLTQSTDLPSAGPLPAVAIEDALDRLTMQVQELTSRVDGTGVGLPGTVAGNVLQDTAAFADAAARGETLPRRVSQLGVQEDDGSLWVATGVGAGAWDRANGGTQRTFANLAALLGATPLFVGEVATITEDWTVWVAVGESAGQWNLAWTSHPDVWSRQPWRHDEIILPTGNDYRWAGNIPRQFIVERVTVHVGQVGLGTLKVRVHLPHSGRQVTVAELVLTGVNSQMAEGTDLNSTVRGTIHTPSKTWQGGISAGAPSGPYHMERLEVEIVEAGAATSTGIVSGSNLSTPAGGNFTNLLTGAPVTVPGHGDQIFVIGNDGAGTVNLSHPSNATGTVNSISKPRLHVIGISDLTLTANDTTIPVSDTEIKFIRVGAEVTGPTVVPGSRVTAVDTTPGDASFAISIPLTTTTTQVSVVETARPPVHRFTGISGVLDDTTLTLPHTVGVKRGDSLVGVNIPEGTYITSDPAGNVITLSQPLTGAVGEVFVHSPQRTGSAAAGSSTVELSNVVGIKIGQKVSGGAGVPGDTWVENVSSPDVVLSRALSIPISNEPLTFTDDVIRVSGATFLGDQYIVLPHAVSATSIAVGNLVTGDGIPAGTFVNGISGSSVSLTNEAQATLAAAELFFHAQPEWKGLEVSLLGHWISSTPPR